MNEKKGHKLCIISDEIWEILKEDIPEPQRSDNKKYKRRPGGERKDLPKRQVLEGIVYVLRTGF